MSEELFITKTANDWINEAIQQPETSITFSTIKYCVVRKDEQVTTYTCCPPLDSIEQQIMDLKEQRRWIDGEFEDIILRGKYENGEFAEIFLDVTKYNKFLKGTK